MVESPRFTDQAVGQVRFARVKRNDPSSSKGYRSSWVPVILVALSKHRQTGELGYDCMGTTRNSVYKKGGSRIPVSDPNRMGLTEARTYLWGAHLTWIPMTDIGEIIGHVDEQTARNVVKLVPEHLDSEQIREFLDSAER